MSSDDKISKEDGNKYTKKNQAGHLAINCTRTQKESTLEKTHRSENTNLFYRPSSAITLNCVLPGIIAGTTSSPSWTSTAVTLSTLEVLKYDRNDLHWISIVVAVAQSNAYF